MLADLLFNVRQNGIPLLILFAIIAATIGW
jgi:hypothetical protein